MSHDQPQFTGITSYRDPGGNYSFRHPWDWQVHELSEGEGGVMLHPPDEPATFFATRITRGSVPVEPDDADALADGFDAGLAALPDCTQLSGSTGSLGNLVRLERELTFTEDGATRKRHTWALYAGTLQLLIIYQGASPEAYDHWLPMGNYCYTTLDLNPDSWCTPAVEHR